MEEIGSEQKQKETACLINEEVVNHSYDTEQNPERQEEVISIDKGFERAGGFGRYQIYALIFGICLLSNNCFLIYNISLFQSYPEFQCLNQTTNIWEFCPREQACLMGRDEWRPDFSASTSIHNWVEQLDLFCRPQSDIGFLGTSLFAGILFSMIFVIPMSDRYGRKPMLVLNAILGTLAQGAFLFFNSLSSFYILMFMMGISAALNPCVGYPYIMEIIEKRHETLVITLSQIGEGIPTIIGPIYFMAYGKTWQALAQVLCQLLCQEAKKVMLSISKFNGKAIDQNFRFTRIATQRHMQQNNNYQIIRNYLRDSTFLKNFIVMIILWITVSYSFYLMSFYLANMEGDINLNSLLQGIGMLVSYAIAAPIINKIGIKWSFMLFFSVACLSAVLYITIPVKSVIFVSFMVFLARLGICPCYSLAFICSNKLFPAEVKSTLLAICNIIARGLCMSAPLVAGLRDPFPFYVFGIMCFVCAIATQMLNLNHEKYLAMYENKGENMENQYTLNKSMKQDESYGNINNQSTMFSSPIAEKLDKEL
eukprot:403371714